MENLEQQLISSRKVREFLKHFSETQWSRVVKASVIMGIQELERTNQIHNLSCQDLEDIVVSNEASLRSENPSVANDSHQNTAVINKAQVNQVQEPHQKQDPNSKVQQQRDRRNSLPVVNHQAPQQVQALRRGARPTQGTQIVQQPQDSAREQLARAMQQERQRPATSGGNQSTAFSKPHFIQGLTATVTSRQKRGIHPSMDASMTTMNDSIVQDLATFGDQQIVYNATVPVHPGNLPVRSQSQPRNLERGALLPQQNQNVAAPQYQVIQHALPQGKEEQRGPPQAASIDDQDVRRVKPSANWRERREPNFSKIGDREHEKRVHSEQTRIRSRPQAGRPTTGQQRVNEQQQKDIRRPRNLLPAQMSLGGQRAQSLNPLVYPSWWGDAELDQPKNVNKAQNQKQHHSPANQNRQQIVINQTPVPVMTAQPRTRNQMYNAEAYVNTDMTLEQNQTPYREQPGAEYQGHSQGRTQGSFQMAAQRQYTETSMTQNSSTISLADALQQAKATADRLQRDIDQSKRHRAHLLSNTQQQQVQQQAIVSQNQENPLIVDIRNEDHIRQHQAMQQAASTQQQRQSSRNSSNRELRSKQQPQGNRRQNMHSTSATNQENYQRNGSRQQLSSRQGGSSVVLQHSPPSRTTKTQQARQKYNSQMVRNRAISQNKDTSSGPLPTYLKGVTSKIRDQVQQDKHYGQNTHTQNVPVEIYVAPPPQQQQKQDQLRSKRSRRGEQQQNRGNENQQSYEDSYGRLVKLKYQHSDMNQQYAAQHHQQYQQQQLYDQQQHQQYQQHHQQNQYYQQPPQQQYDHRQPQQYQQMSVQDPAIMNNNTPRQNNVGELCQDLLDSPYIQKFVAPENQQQQIQHHYQQPDESSSQFDDTQNQGNHSTTQEDVSKQNDDSTIQTHHLNAMSNGAPLSQGGNQPHLFSVENSSSMVMYNATVKNQGTNMKTDTSASNKQVNDPNFQFSNGNQILFDSKAFDGMPSQLHQINSQTGAPTGTGHPSSFNNLNTLNNQPFSVENQTLSPSQDSQQTDEKYRHNKQKSSQYSQNEQARAFQSAGFGGGQQQDQQQQFQSQSQYRLSDYEAEQQQNRALQENHPLFQPQQQQQHVPYNDRGGPLRNQTGHDLQQMRRNQPGSAYGQTDPQQQYAPAEEQNFSKLIERVDMASEETKIMTFKSQDNGFFQPGQGPDDSRLHEGHLGNNQINYQDQSQYQQRQPNDYQGSFEPTGTQGTQYDKRGSMNTLSQMTNPFRTGIYNNPANGTTMMSQSEMGHTRGNHHYGGTGPLQNSDSKLQDDDQFSSPEENKTMQQESHPPGALQNNYRQETDHDPSSSEISGYDLKGMLSRVRNQANYVQNNVLKNNDPAQSPKYPSDQYGDGPRHQYSGSGFSQPANQMNSGHQFMSQNIPAGDQTPYTPLALSHVVSQQNPASARNTAGEAPSSYHPVVSQDFNPLKTTLGNQEDEIPNSSSGIKSQEESKRHPISTNRQKAEHHPTHQGAYEGDYHYHQQQQQQNLPQFNKPYLPQQLPASPQLNPVLHQQMPPQNQQMLQAQEIPARAPPSHRSSDINGQHQQITHHHQSNSMNTYLMANKKSANTDSNNEQQNDTTMTDDLSDYSSSAHELGQSSRHHQSNANMNQQQMQMQQQQTQSQAHLMMMPKQLQPSASQKQAPAMVQNFVQPPAQIHQDNQESQSALEARMQDFINSQKSLQAAQSQAQISNQNQAQISSQQAISQHSSAQQQPPVMQFNPPQNNHLKPMTDTDTSSDDDDLSSGSGLTGTDTSGIDTSSMSQSMQSSAGPKGSILPTSASAGTNLPGMTSMPKQVKNQYPAMAFNHPKYAGTLSKHQ